MARRRENMLLEMMARDPRLRMVPLAAQAVWMRLMLTMQELGGSVLRFGSEVPNRSDISRCTAIAETELETHLPLLLRYELLRLEPDGAIAAPTSQEPDRRAAAARINGLKGGRPRKDRSSPSREQREMVLPIAGGRASSETQSEPSVSPAIAKLKLEEAKAKLADGDVQKVGRAAMEAAGLDPATGGHAGIVKRLLTDGIDEATILGVIQARMAAGAAPSHLGYFDRAIREAHADGRYATPAAPTARFLAWEAAVTAYRAGGRRGEFPLLEWFDVDGQRRAA